MPNPALPKSYIFDLDHKEFVIKITADKHLQLFVDGCLRKYDDSADPVLYVWTNVELLWEEHRYVEARYHRASDRLRVTVNRMEVTHREVS